MEGERRGTFYATISSIRVCSPDRHASTILPFREATLRKPTFNYFQDSFGKERGVQVVEKERAGVRNQGCQSKLCAFLNK